MKHTLHLYLKCLLRVTVCLVLTASSKAETVSETVYSPLLERAWKYHVYLPPSFDAADDRIYPALFLLHGSAGDETDWDSAFPSLDDLILRNAICPLIAIAPASGTSWWVDGVEPIESAFFADLLPDFRSKYAVSDDREARVVAGFSMGGYGAMRFALAYPERFGGAILLSPALYEDLPAVDSSARSSGAFGAPFDARLWTSRNYPALLPAYLAGENLVQLFIGAGDDDWHHRDAHDMNMEIQATLFYNTLNKQHGNPAELRIADGSHDWALWLPLLEEGMQVMARKLPLFRASPTGCSMPAT